MSNETPLKLTLFFKAIFDNKYEGTLTPLLLSANNEFTYFKSSFKS